MKNLWSMFTNNNRPLLILIINQVHLVNLHMYLMKEQCLLVVGPLFTDVSSSLKENPNGAGAVVSKWYVHLPTSKRSICFNCPCGIVVWAEIVFTWKKSIFIRYTISAHTKVLAAHVQSWLTLVCAASVHWYLALRIPGT